MNTIQKEQIRRLRHEGTGYSKIALSLGLSENTVKSYCKRNNLGGIGAALPKPEGSVCRNCGKPVIQLPGQKKRVFCSDACRVVWWNTHPEMVSRRAIYRFTCANCGTTFKSYGDKNRKYCSHACYVADQFEKTKAGFLP